MNSHNTYPHLVDVAARLFHSRGYAATGVARILDESEIGSGSLYHFFRTKEALLLAVLEQYQERLKTELMGPVRERTQDPVERVFGVLASYRRFLEDTECTLGCPIGNLAGEVSDTSEAARRGIASLFEAWCSEIRGFLEEGRSAFPRGTDLDALSVFVLTVMEGAVMQARVARSLEPFDQSVSMLRDYFDRLVAEELRPAKVRASSRPQKGNR